MQILPRLPPFHPLFMIYHFIYLLVGMPGYGHDFHTRGSPSFPLLSVSCLPQDDPAGARTSCFFQIWQKVNDSSLRFVLGNSLMTDFCASLSPKLYEKKNQPQKRALFKSYITFNVSPSSNLV